VQGTEKRKKMNRKELTNEVGKYFGIHELVCRDVFKKYGTGAWMFLDERLLQLLLILRTEILKSPMTINNWGVKGQFSQRGLRCNRCELVKNKQAPYMSAHVLGKAFDCDVKGMTAKQARDLIVANADKIPFPIRMEDGVNWLHVDVYDNGSGNKITLFKA